MTNSNQNLIFNNLYFKFFLTFAVIVIIKKSIIVLTKKKVKLFIFLCKREFYSITASVLKKMSQLFASSMRLKMLTAYVYIYVNNLLLLKKLIHLVT